MRAALELTPHDRVSNATKSIAMGNIPIALPTLHEQQSITTYLDHRTAENDTAINLINSQIQSLNGYRQALISEAVTGKINVRGIVQ